MKKSSFTLGLAILALAVGNCIGAPTILVRGLSVTILNGDLTPTAGDNTHFGDVTACGASAAHDFMIYNFGDTPLTVTGIVLSGGNASEFQVGSVTHPVVIPSGGAWSTFTVTFTPGGSGARAATISIASDDTNANPYAFAIAGNGVAPEIVLACATNKTVSCGAAWTFDPPAASDSCKSTNVTLTVLETVTNGVSPMVITRTWQATEPSANSVTCSQTVTVQCATNPCTDFVVNGSFETTSPAMSPDASNNALDPNAGVPGWTTDSTNFLEVWCNDVGIPAYDGTNQLEINAQSDDETVSQVITGLSTTCPATFCFDYTGRFGLAGNAAGPDTPNNDFTVTLTSGDFSFTVPLDPAAYATGGWLSFCTNFVPTTSTVTIAFRGRPHFSDGTIATQGGAHIDNVSLTQCCDTNPCLIVTGATNKAVECGSIWQFDPPTATSCCSTDITITSIGIATNGDCPKNITQTWLITDGCGDTNTCSQTVTVTNVPPVFGCIPAVTIFSAGTTNDDFAGPEPAFPSAGLLLRLHLGSSKDFDDCVINTFFADTFTNLPSCITGATLHIRLKGCGSSYDDDDTLALGFTAMDGTLLPSGWSRYLGNNNGVGAPGLLSYWANGTLADIVLDLSQLPNADGSTTNLIPALNVQGFLDIVEQDDSSIDFIVLTVTNCCGSDDKTVDDGTLWTFDTPTATDSCSGTNVTLTVISTVTNGYCPQVITRTWLATDACGDTSTHSQTVTLLDSTPPVITCITNTIIVPLDANCQLEIPTIRPKASDNFTPANQLTYTQDPPAGTIAKDTCQLVTVTVMDVCGNGSQCQVQVCGQDKTPPTLIYPKLLAATNCIVPNVLAFVSASDPCTASNKLVFSQSPAAGTPIAAGGNIVTVMVTDPSGNTSTGFIPLISSGPQSFLDAMFNTGVDSNRAGLPISSVDPHYTLGSVPTGTPTGPSLYNAPNAIVAETFFGLPPFTLSRWIAPFSPIWNFNDLVNGYYTYTNQFILPPGADLLTASISGRWAPYTGGKMYFNGSSTPVSSTPSPAFASYYPHWTYFTINSGFLPYPAVNNISYVVQSTEYYTALRVEFTDAAANCSTCTPPAAIYSTASQSLPINSTAVFSVNVWGTPPLTIQWYHNGQPLANGGHFFGVNTTILTITPVDYADAGNYNAAVSDPCGETDGGIVKLTVTKGSVLPWAWWNFSQIAKPLAAVIGPDLILAGTNGLGISGGTALDFGLPLIAGKNVNVLYVPPLTNGTCIQLPLGEMFGTNPVSNYTILMDVYAPGNSPGGARLLTIFDRWGNLYATATPLGGVNVSGMVDGASVNMDSSMSLQPGAWNRIAMVVDTGDQAEPAESGQLVSTGNIVINSLYINGKPCGSMNIPADSALSITGSMATVFSSPDGTTGELYVSSLQFHAEAMTPEMIAGIGSPDNGPIPASDTSVGASPVLTATTPNGMVNLSWSDGPFQLQETSDLGGDWKDSLMPFDEVQNAGGGITTTAHINPMNGPAMFFRLKYAP